MRIEDELIVKLGLASERLRDLRLTDSVQRSQNNLLLALAESVAFLLEKEKRKTIQKRR